MNPQPVLINSEFAEHAQLTEHNNINTLTSSVPNLTEQNIINTLTSSVPNLTEQNVINTLTSNVSNLTEECTQAQIITSANMHNETKLLLNDLRADFLSMVNVVKLLTNSINTCTDKIKNINHEIETLTNANIELKNKINENNAIFKLSCSSTKVEPSREETEPHPIKVVIPLLNDDKTNNKTNNKLNDNKNNKQKRTGTSYYQTYY